MEAEAAPSKERYDVVRALLRLLFYKATRIYWSLYEEGGVQLAESEQSRIFRLAVEKHFRTTTSVSDYAKYLHVTADHLGAVVRGQTGRTPGDIIRERLLLEAKRALNFEDPAYFSRFFRR